MHGTLGIKIIFLDHRIITVSQGLHLEHQAIPSLCDFKSSSLAKDNVGHGYSHVDKVDFSVAVRCIVVSFSKWVSGCVDCELNAVLNKEMYQIRMVIY